MKKTTCLILLLVLGLFCACDFNFGGNDDSVSAVMFVKHYYTGRRAPDWDVIHVPSVWVSANISGTQMPQVDSVKIADIIYSGSMYFSPDQGEMHFSMEHRIWSDSIPAPHFDPLSIKISTDMGELSGSITVPDTIESLSIHAADTIPLGTPVTISWTGSDADYYILEYCHSWMPYECCLLTYSCDTVVTAESVTFDSTYFIYNGEISDIRIYPFNGPFPQIGAAANMEGDGYGYLFCENQMITSDRSIVLGEGIDNVQFFKAQKMSPDTLSIQEKIKIRLGL